MIRNLVFDVGNVIVTERGANDVNGLSHEEQRELNHLIFSEESGFREVILGNITTTEYRNYLINKAPKFEREIKIILNPYDQSMSLPKKPEVIDLLYELRSDGYKIYFLSDMIDITYNYLRDVLEDFGGGAYSFMEHLKKPDEKFFQLLLKRYTLNPQETAFFDDKPINVEAARKLGIRAVVFDGVEVVLEILKAEHCIVGKGQEGFASRYAR